VSGRRGRATRATARPVRAAPALPGLSPRGAVAARFGGAAADPFRGLGIDPSRLDLGASSTQLVEEVVACADSWAGPRERAALGLALLATDVAARQGSTRVPLDPKGPLRDLVRSIVPSGNGDADVDERVADILAVTTRATLGSRGGGLVGDPGETRPLIVDDGAVYQHRLWWLETRLAAQLAARIAAAPLDPPDRVADAVAAVVARPATVTLTAQQAAAIRTALTGRLGVISGGPGTGKTAIVVSLLRALAGLGVTEIGLAAPTGKAANRISESVARDLGALGDVVPPAAQTLHRLLGWRPDGGFRHSELSPLPHAAVIVDEASMVDLALMERLVRALRPDARLILLGDAHQLPSVDAGAVLADLVGLARATGAPWAIELTESHRMRADDPDGRAILEAARAIDAGRPEHLGAWRTGMRSVNERGVERVRIDTAAQLGEALDAWWQATADDPAFARLSHRAYRRRHGAWDDDDAAALEALLALHESRRLLTGTRGLDTGAAAVNARLHRRMLERASVERAPEFVPGEPVMITANDYERGLYNGDQGVVVRVVDDDGAQRFRAVFRVSGRPGGTGGPSAGLVPLPIDAVRASMELAWAMTVHKSQGSELERIALVLPREDLPLVTRELLYTALTRARRGALLLGTDDVLAAGAARTAARQSGLAARLRGP